MSSETYSGLAELSAVQHFVGALQSRDKPFKAQDAHCLLVQNQAVKDFLQSKWKLSDLEIFFRKYTQYFNVEADGKVSLKNSDLTLDELKCVGFFLGLLVMRENRPIHITLSFNFVNISGVEQFLRTKYNVKDLTPFFKNHTDFFLLDNGFISLKGCRTSQASTTHEPVPKETIPDLSKSEKNYIKKMDKMAVEFFIALILKHVQIYTKHAHSFLGDNVKLRDHLRKHYTLSKLGCFFESHSDYFFIKGPVVCLAPVSAKNEALFSKTAAALKTKPPDPDEAVERKTVDFYCNLIKEVGEISTDKAHSFLQDNVDIRNYLKTHYQLSNLQPFFAKHSDVFSVKGKIVHLASLPKKHKPPVSSQSMKPPGPKISEKNQHSTGLASRRSSNASAASVTNNIVPVPNCQTVGVSKQEKNSSSSISENTNLTKLLSLVMSFDSPSMEDRTSVNLCRTVEDAACQTLSTGPILSLNVICEKDHG